MMSEVKFRPPELQAWPSLISSICETLEEQSASLWNPVFQNDWLGHSCQHVDLEASRRAVKMMLRLWQEYHVVAECCTPLITTSAFSLQMTAEALHRLVSDPVLPFYPLDIALDVQNKLKGRLSTTPACSGS